MLTVDDNGAVIISEPICSLPAVFTNVFIHKQVFSNVLERARCSTETRSPMTIVLSSCIFACVVCDGFVSSFSAFISFYAIGYTIHTLCFAGIGQFWLTSLAVVNSMRMHPHRQQEQLSSGQHTVLTGVPFVFFIVLAGYLVCVCYASMSVLKTVAVKSEQRDDEDPYKAKLEGLMAHSWHTHTHTQHWLGG